jgi:hypothetical protein
MITAYRIHSADEAAKTVLDAERPDGWVASDEAYETQPHGVSACLTLRELATYVSLYSLAIQPGDRVLALRGTYGDDDRDQHAVRVIVESYEDLGDAQAWHAAYTADLDELAEEIENGEDLGAYYTPETLAWLRCRCQDPAEMWGVADEDAILATWAAYSGQARGAA